NEGLTQSQIKDVGIAAIKDIEIDTADGLTEAIDANMTDVTTLEDAVRVINTAIAERVAAGDADAAAIADAGFQASLRVNNDGSTTIAITANFSAEDFTVSGGEVTLVGGGAGDEVDLFESIVTATQVNLTEVDLSTREAATQALGAVDGALTQINSLRAELGAVQVRFESTISNLSVSVENQSAARSRIQDADFAAETAALTKAQILQQAGISVLSQANASTQSVLALLQ
ncbi:flagellin, partial [Thioalkalivibrio sp.]|uniref:flagellin n=1 Tax=Thioalkalivibrio sp. TaxID=2093813 RepID=UPI0012D5ABF7